jgi:hypothetical protein
MNPKHRLALLISIALIALAIFVLLWWLAHEEEPDPIVRGNHTVGQAFDALKSSLAGKEVQYTSRYPDGTVIKVAQAYKNLERAGCEITITIADPTFVNEDYLLKFNLADLLPRIRPVKMLYTDTAVWRVPVQTLSTQDLIEQRGRQINYDSIAATTSAQAKDVVNALHAGIKACEKLKADEAAKKPAPEPRAE